MPSEVKTERPPVCDYEGSDYQERFWEKGERRYEDQVEAVALRRLLPKQGKLLLEVGAGAGRNTPRYAGFEHVVLIDYSTTQLERAQQRLGASNRYTYVAADAYRLPFVDGLFDTATMIRVIHHMADAPKALAQIHATLQPRAKFILEFANKRNMKSILRYWLRKQEWNPFDPDPVEFVELNFDFHPATMRGWLQVAGFTLERQLTVSHFRMGWLKHNIPTGLLVALDSFFQPTGALWQYTPSVFLRSRASGETSMAKPGAFFKCPECSTPLPSPDTDSLKCPGCSSVWAKTNGIWNFKQPS
jgi:SAM-dependent methyltransferase